MAGLLVLLVQIGVILVAARVVGAAFRRIGQPQVVGEMAAGILLGPSLLGRVAPGLSATLFPPGSLTHLDTLSQLGLVLFMFLVGLEFDPRLMRGRGQVALVTSHVSIVVPFFLGAALALHLYPRLSDASVPFEGFTLFMGAAMSVTAFPVLARILQERDLMRTRVGAVTIACAAVDDVSAWAILAVVVALVRAHALHTPLWLTLAGSAVYVVLMVTAVRRWLRRLEDAFQRTGRVSQDMLAVVLLAALASAWVTEWLGIHALFGAFCIGAVMPNDRAFVHHLAEKIEPVTVVLLLPLFFANAGLKTSLGLVSGAEMWGYFGLVMLVAVGGKFGGSTLAARTLGLSWREASALGILMNTRGLMELVILSIGLELGVISPALFAMMVLMALLTTFMTTPLLHLLYPERLRDREGDRVEPDEYTIVLPVALAASGPGLLRVARAAVPTGRIPRVHGVHLRPDEQHVVSDLQGLEVPADEHALQPLLRAAADAGVAVRPLVFTSSRPGRDIADLARLRAADVVVLGWHAPLDTALGLGGVTVDVLAGAPCDVLIYVERRFGPWTRVVARDAAHLAVAERIAANAGVPLVTSADEASDHDLVVLGVAGETLVAADDDLATHPRASLLIVRPRPRAGQ